MYKFLITYILSAFHKLFNQINLLGTIYCNIWLLGCRLSIRFQCDTDNKRQKENVIPFFCCVASFYDSVCCCLLACHVILENPIFFYICVSLIIQHQHHYHVDVAMCGHITYKPRTACLHNSVNESKKVA